MSFLALVFLALTSQAIGQEIWAQTVLFKTNNVKARKINASRRAYGVGYQMTLFQNKYFSSIRKPLNRLNIHEPNDMTIIQHFLNRSYFSSRQIVNRPKISWKKFVKSLVDE